ncbi:MAG TPA: UDP-2,4-diacetamido-2,4,6-trideoxy-beta-L-altropyranose hydrolase [Stellaceae bacterium]|jgi:UDP-2,4-diacetamido-2,4,6-trideoxy-beta-L-altropyranose hydrolase
MRVAFRVDAGHEIGSGHFFRCLALADTLAVGGDRCFLVSRNLPEALRAQADRHGHVVIPLKPAAPFAPRPGDTTHAAWLNAPWEDDADATKAALTADADWLVVDHFAIDHRWEERVAPAVSHTLVIDDLADRRHVCAILVDQNLFPGPRGRYRGLVPGHCETLLGPRHALLRGQFEERRKGGIRQRRTVDRVLVTLGGSDPANFTAIGIEGLKRLNPPMRADIVIGGESGQRDAIAAACRGDERFRVHANVENMADLLAAADLAIGAAGISSWERACLGLPAVIVTLAANQEGVAQELARRGLARLLGRADEVDAALVAHAIEALRRDPAALARMSRIAARFVDGKGAHRVANAMRARLISLRRATEDDAERLLAWRNDPITRLNSLHNETVTLSDHKTWLAATLRDPDVRLLVGSIEAEAVGTVRLDRLDDGARRVSITVSPDWRGRGVGHAVLRAACREIVSGRLIAEIRDDNVASQRLFRGCGFRRTSHDGALGVGIYTARIGRG